MSLENFNLTCLLAFLSLSGVENDLLPFTICSQSSLHKKVVTFIIFDEIIENRIGEGYFNAKYYKVDIFNEFRLIA